MKYFIFIFLFYSMPLFAGMKTLTLNYASYGEAKKAAQFLRFDMKSTKVGMITTSFTGFVKKAEISYQESAHSYTDVTISFGIEDMDTDVQGRNKKMWDKCLDIKNHSKIIVKIAKIEKGLTPQLVPATINILGEDHTFVLNISQSDDKLLGGDAVLSLKDLKIPDPSIFIASVSDEIRVSFHFKKEN